MTSKNSETTPIIIRLKNDWIGELDAIAKNKHAHRVDVIRDFLGKGIKNAKKQNKRKE